jgi:hypothetical protein
MRNLPHKIESVASSEKAQEARKEVISAHTYLKSAALLSESSGLSADKLYTPIFCK